MKVISLLYIGMTVLMYPLWNMVFVSTLLFFGSNLSVLVFKLKTYLPLALLLLLIFILYDKNKKLNKDTMILTAIAVFLLLINVVNSMFRNAYSVVDYSINFFTVYLFISVFLITTFNIKPYVEITILEKILKLFFFICFVVVVFGLCEKIFISDDVLLSTHYYSLLGTAKGMDFRTYIHPVPDNLFSGFSGVRIRRMVSIVGEPLYLSYYLLIPLVWSCVHFIKKRTVNSAILHFVFLLGVVLALSRNIMLAAMVVIVLLYLNHSKYVRYIMPLLISLLPIATLGGFFSLKYFSENDASYSGHMFSIVHFMEHIGLFGLFIPTEDTILNNFLLLKHGGEYTVESSILLIISNIGIFSLVLFCVAVFVLIKQIKASSRIAVTISRVNVRFFYAETFYVAFPYIIIGYLVTTITSPHIMTFQLLFLLNGLSIMYILIKSLIGIDFDKTQKRAVNVRNQIKS